MLAFYPPCAVEVRLRSGHRTVPRLWHVFPKRVKLGPQHTFWCKLVGSLVLWPHHWRRTTGAGARRRCSAPIVTSAPLVGGHKTSEPTSFVASESPSKTTPESYNRTPYARDGRRNTDTQQVLRLGAGAPLCLCVHITRVPPHRRSRACSGEPAFCGHASPTPTPPLLARPGTSPEQLGATQEVGG